MTDQKLIDDVLTAFADRDITAPSRDDIARVLEVFETSLRLCGCDACTTARRERIGLTDHDLTSLARVLHEVVYSPGASFDRAVPGIQEHMRACAEKVAAALPWVVPTPEVELVVGEAHTPTDDEREAIITALLDELGWEWDEVPEEHIPSSRSILGDMADRVLAVTAGFRRSEVPEPSAPGEHGGTIPLYGMLDVWMALYGTSRPEFDAFYAEHGYAESWARILAAVRQRRAEPQGEPSDAQVTAALDAFNRDAPSYRQRMRAALRAAGGVR